MKSMKLVKACGVVWGIIYFLIGAVFSFTLGNNQFWTGATVYLCLFFLPLPISVMAFWLPRISGVTLIVCAAVSVIVSGISAALSGPVPDLAGLFKFAMFHVPHLAFAAVYLKAWSVNKEADTVSQSSN
jgi:hypothetical protein